MEFTSKSRYSSGTNVENKESKEESTACEADHQLTTALKEVQEENTKISVKLKDLEVCFCFFTSIFNY